MNTGEIIGQISNRTKVVDSPSYPGGAPSCQAEFERGLSVSGRPNEV